MSLGSDHTGWNEQGYKLGVESGIPAADALASMPVREEAVRDLKPLRTAVTKPPFEGGSVEERLRATVGDERANGVVRAIGVAAQHAAGGNLPIPLESVVSQTLARLTQADLAGLIKGDTSVINRVQAMAEEQVKAAQAAQPSQNIHGAAAGKTDGISPNGQGGLFGVGKTAALQGVDKAKGDANGGRLSSEAYNRGFLGAAGNAAFLESQGLNTGIGKELGKLGFTKPEQIRQIVNDAHKLDLAPKDAAVDLAHLRHGEGTRTDEHIGALKDYGDSLTAANKMETEAQKIQDPAKRAEAMQKAAEARKQAEEKAEKHDRERVQSSEGHHSFRRVRDKVRTRCEHQRKLNGVQNDVHNRSQVERIAQNQLDGTQRAVEQEHRKTVAQFDTKSEAASSAADSLLAMDDTKPAAKPTPEKKLPQLAAKVDTDKKPKPEAPKEPRMAANAKGLNPTV